MNGNPEPFPVVVITGPTASGKTGLALELAERYDGEIICADSRTVYTGMDIGTAKPTPSEQARIRHHLVDVVEPRKKFTLHDFQQLAQAAIADIRERGKIPFMVGGTGLYIDSIVLDFELGPPASDDERASLETMTTEGLQQMLKIHHVDLPVNEQNRRHLIRAWERRNHQLQSREKPVEDTLVVAISTEKTTLDARIRARAEQMFSKGVINEAKALAAKYGWNSEAMSGNIYPILRRVIDKEVTVDEAIELIIVRDRQLAKRQVTWLKRHDFVIWKTLTGARDYLESEIEHRLSSRNVLG